MVWSGELTRELQLALESELQLESDLDLEPELEPKLQDYSHPSDGSCRYRCSHDKSQACGVFRLFFGFDALWKTSPL